jgi:hypothetical protein
MKKSSRENLNKIREHFQKSGGSSDNRWFKVKEPERGQESSVTIRVLPAWGKGAIVEGVKFFYYTGAQHYGFSIGGRNRAIACPEASDRGPCPICKFIARLKRADGSPTTKKLLEGKGNIRQSRIYWINIINREEPGVVKIYGTNKKFIETILDANDDYGDITDAASGRDITIKRKGTGFQTRYRYVVRGKESTIEYEKKDVHQLDKDVQEWMSYGDMVQALKDNYSEELAEVGMKFKDASPITKKKKKVKEEEDESNSEDDDIEEEDTEEDDEDNESDAEIEEDEDEEEDTVEEEDDEEEE